MEVSAFVALQHGGFRGSEPSLGSWAGSHPENMCLPPPGTNINDAMLTAVRLLQSANQKELLSDGSVSLIILLTDGDPTVGEDTASNPRAHRPGRGRWGSRPACMGPEVGVVI